jgi:hypothetical protein
MKNNRVLPALVFVSSVLAGPACSGASIGDSGSPAAGAAGMAGQNQMQMSTSGAGGSPATPSAGTTNGGSSVGAGGSAGMNGGSAGVTGAGSGGMPAAGGDTGMPDPDFETKFPPDKRRMLIRDEGMSSLHYVNLANPAENWVVKTTGWARGMQLVGDDVVLGGREDGYEEYDLKTGMVLKQVKNFGNTQSAYRMENGETMLAQNGTTLSFLEPKTDVVKHKIDYAGYGYIRMVRPTPKGTYLLPADDHLAEGDADGKILWDIKQPGWGHIWEALMLPDQSIVLGTAFGASLDFLDPTTHMVVKQFGTKKMADAATIAPNFFAEFQILPNGNFITSNWQGHGDSNGGKGRQIVEFDPTGKVVWSYQQDAKEYSSIQGVMVLDGLDTKLLHIESVNGMWTPVR